MANKKSKFLFYMNCLLLLSAIGIFFGLHFQIQPVYAITNETIISEASEQNADKFTANDIFEDYTQTSLKDDFNTVESISELYEQGKIDQKVFERAKEVLEGNVKYTYQREFSTTFNDEHKIAQVGNLYTYSNTTLRFNFPTCEFNLTGIYGLTGQTIRVFVAADQNYNLPEIVFTQNHGYYTTTSWKREKQLKLGMNEFQYDDFVTGSSYISQTERKGGAIYIRNPYTKDQQGEVSVYIEGGGYYPIFRKGDDEKQFLSALAEYYSQYSASSTMLDMAELVTDHALITTTAESLYNTYIENNEISPTENLQLWGNYMNEVFKFNGIEESEQNKYIVVNFRYMSTYKNSGAYTYFNHIGFYDEHEWFANFLIYKSREYNTNDHLIFGIGHELGHMIDIDNRCINETTNNFTAAIAYYKILGMPQHNHASLGYEQYAPFDKTLSNIASDYTLKYEAYHDGKIMYTYDYVNGSGTTIKADHNYLIWWDLECAFPGYWARLNNLYQSKELIDLSNLERMVYYSSIATQVDLSYYFERWGFYWSDETYTDLANRFVYEKSTEKFRQLMSQAEKEGEILKTNAPYWYADTLQYDFIQKNKNVPENERKYDNIKPQITKITQSGNERTIFISNGKSENHLGFQVWSKTQNTDWKVAGFTYSSSFVDRTSYSSTPTYKVVAYNRFFNASQESDEKSDITQDSESVCKLEGQTYSKLDDAIAEALSGQTIYLLADCTIEKSVQLYRQLSFAVDSSVNSDITITVNNSFIQMVNNFSIIGNQNARIILDGRSIEYSNPLIYISSGTFVAKYVTFQNLSAKYLAGAIYGMDSAELHHCVFDNCKNSGSFAVVEAHKNLTMEDCVFKNLQSTDVSIKDISNLTLINKINNFSLTFDDFSEEKEINLVGISTKDEIDKITLKSGYILTFDSITLKIKPESYNLKFYINGAAYETIIYSPSFEFGSEEYEYQLSKNQYVKYVERKSESVYYSGDTINLNGDMEFDVEVKSKIKLTTYYNEETSTQFYPEGMGVYLPTIDTAKQKVVAYLDGNNVYYAGQIYVLEKDSSLVAIYEGNFVYRYIVKNQIYSVKYGKYNDQIELIKLEDDNFQGWQCGNEILSNNLVLRGDTDLIAVFENSQQVYDLSQCEIQVDGSYTYSGKQIIPKITVYFNGMIVPSKCYTILCSNNISASKQAQVTISFVQGLSTGSKTQTFTISPKQLSRNDVEVTGLKDFVYNGSQTTQSLTLTYQNQAIDTFRVNYNGDRTNAGDVQIEITFFDNYSGTIYLQYTITKAERNGFRVSMPDWIYGGNASSPSVEGKMEEAQITYSYSTSQNGSYTSEKPTNAGTYWIKAEILASQNYSSAEATASFTIEKADHPENMPNTEITISRKAKTLQDVNLDTEGWNWETPSTKIAGESMTAMAVYSDKENYVNYTVLITLTKEPRKNVSSLSVEIETKDFVYDGTKKTPKVIAKDGDLVLVLGEDYDVQYESNTFAGQGKAIVTFKNDYTGSITLDFTISKAEKPSVDTILKIHNHFEDLSEIELPDDFEWVEDSLQVISETKMIAKAIYKGSDANSYETTELTFEIIIEEQEQNPPEEQGSLIWLAFVVPVSALLVGWIVFAIVRHKKKEWWKCQ